LRAIVDITLALILFIDAANADLNILRSSMKIPGRMLIVGMPLVILLGVVAGWYLFPGMAIFELCILATILAATDAALGKGVITNMAVPSRIREGLNAESGLNDGLAVPIFFVFIALATGAGSDQDSTLMALSLVARELGIGAVVGLGLVSDVIMIAACGLSFAALAVHPGAWMFFFMVFIAMGWPQLDSSLYELTVAERFYGEIAGVVAAMIGISFLLWWQKSRSK
jgi:NhaP-type Na+/H+ or K+/H+ antiporter